jgi:hypothetical protein
VSAGAACRAKTQVAPLRAIRTPLRARRGLWIPPAALQPSSPPFPLSLLYASCSGSPRSLSPRSRRFGRHKGFWSRSHPEARSLKQTVAWLLSLGYACFMEAGRDYAPVSGECWRDGFGNQGWSNVLCAHSNRGLGLLNTLSQEGYARRQRQRNVEARGSGKGAGD